MHPVDPGEDGPGPGGGGVALPQGQDVLRPLLVGRLAVGRARRQVARRAEVVAPAHVDLDVGVDPVDGGVEDVDLPVAQRQAEVPGELVELDDVAARRHQLLELLVVDLGQVEGQVLHVGVVLVDRPHGQHLEAGEVDLDGLGGRLAQHPHLLRVQRALADQLAVDDRGVLGGVRRQHDRRAVGREPGDPLGEVVELGGVGAVAAHHQPVGDDVEPGRLLVVDDGQDGVGERLEGDRVGGVAPGRDLTPGLAGEPAGLRVVPHHHRGEEDVLTGDAHVATPSGSSRRRCRCWFGTVRRTARPPARTSPGTTSSRGRARCSGPGGWLRGPSCPR